MQYTDFYTYLMESSTSAGITVVPTDLNNGIKIGFVSKGDSGDRIRASRLRVAYKTKIRSWLEEMDKKLFHELKFNPIEVEVIFSTIHDDDNKYGQEQAYVFQGDNKIFIRSEFLSGKFPDDYVIKLLVHEWSHIWHFAQSSKVDAMIQKQYKLEKASNRKRISNYGLSDHKEFWTFLIENYEKIDQDLKQFVNQVIQKGK